MSTPRPSPPPSADEDDAGAPFAWGSRSTTVAVALGLLIGLVACGVWALDPAGLGQDSDLVPFLATASGVVMGVGVIGRVSTARRQRWTGVHVTWRRGASALDALAPARLRDRGSVGRGDTVAVVYLLLFSPLYVLIVSASGTPRELFGLGMVLTGVMAVLTIPGLVPRVVVTRRTISVRNLFVREDIPRQLLAWMTTYPVGRRGISNLSDGDIEFGLTNGARVRFAAGVVQWGAGWEHLNRRPAKVRVARRLARLLDGVPTDASSGAATAWRAPRRRFGVIALIAVMAAVALIGVALVTAA